jgi:hypothetical protein
LKRSSVAIPCFVGAVLTVAALLCDCDEDDEEEDDDDEDDFLEEDDLVIFKLLCNFQRTSETFLLRIY